MFFAFTIITVFFPPSAVVFFPQKAFVFFSPKPKGYCALCMYKQHHILMLVFGLRLFKDWSLTDQEMKNKTKKSFLQLYLSLHNFSIILYICLIPLDCIVCVINFYTIFYYSPKVAYPWRIYYTKMTRIHEIEISHLGTFNPLPSGSRTDWPYSYLNDKCSKRA